MDEIQWQDIVNRVTKLRILYRVRVVADQMSFWRILHNGVTVIFGAVSRITTINCPLGKISECARFGHRGWVSPRRLWFNPEQFVHYSWWTNWHWGMLCFEQFDFPLLFYHSTSALQSLLSAIGYYVLFDWNGVMKHEMFKTVQVLISLSLVLLSGRWLSVLLRNFAYPSSGQRNKPFRK